MEIHYCSPIILYLQNESLIFYFFAKLMKQGPSLPPSTHLPTFFPPSKNLQYCSCNSVRNLIFCFIFLTNNELFLNIFSKT